MSITAIPTANKATRTKQAATARVAVPSGNKAARTPAGISNPTGLANLLEWHQSGAWTVSTGVSQWTDLSGKGNHILQATGSLQGAVVANAINGFPGVQLDGVDDFFSPNVFAGGNTAAGGTFFFVMRADALSASGTHDFLFVAGAADGINPGVQMTNANYSLIAGGSLNASEVIPTGSFQYLSFVHDGIGTGSVIRRRGATLAIGDDGHSAIGGLGFTLGALAGGTRSFAGTFVEVVIYSRILSVAEIALVEAYLKNRYGL